MIAEMRTPVASDTRTLHVEICTRRSADGGSRFQLEAKLAVSPGVTVIVGHSGAGKTTLLRCIAGLSTPEQGRIAIGDHVLFDSRKKIRLDPARRGIAFVFQDLALFPHLSVEDNVMYGLRKLDPAERKRRMREIVASFQIEHLTSRFPREISGGEQQRAALARALVNRPKILLADEPTGNLDSKTGTEIMDLIRELNRTLEMTVIMVTHERSLAERYANRLVFLGDGKLVGELENTKLEKIGARR